MSKASLAVSIKKSDLRQLATAKSPTDENALSGRCSEIGQETGTFCSQNRAVARFTISDGGRSKFSSSGLFLVTFVKQK
ncbi:MAG: hypothetical protein IKB68_04675 [Rikenellaceae bacterium]|nr:hypothetical protein [Rikenellaceae bacterium]MBR4056117.1 hypothetical protein [Rikenellaceae bacterium]